ncbi:sugar phosphate isomerase/epimerase family protein [Dyadobacter diqingensis]|uniref:sugar phosphate isomerase/epimerase family protein n=1 Tax=Dyadobacter diqingensis TaxID=2938121 RepID=UPI0020C18BDF|nr:TIM barrel protein [Dyadobacter diqingensis]
MNNYARLKQFCYCFFLISLIQCYPSYAQKQQGTDIIYARQNLIAWCIVPFDVKNRGPVERAEMLNKLGITRLAYDWREKHIAEFDQELDALKKHHITLQAFWFHSGPNPENDKTLPIILDVLKRHGIKTQIWCMISGIKDMKKMSQLQKIEAMAKPVGYIADKAAEIGCSVGLYNHGGWYGVPENQLDVIRYLKKPNIGIVYNFHHAEDDITRFPAFFPKILPHLMAVNLMGLKSGNPVKVVPIGQGDSEAEMIRIVRDSAYRGPVGIINEDTAPDAEVGLTMNIEGLKGILKSQSDTKALKTYR